jgi:hypothetical protein
MGFSWTSIGADIAFMASAPADTVGEVRQLVR